jgi:hypothetical protein
MITKKDEKEKQTKDEKQGARINQGRKLCDKILWRQWKGLVRI